MVLAPLNSVPAAFIWLLLFCLDGDDAAPPLENQPAGVMMIPTPRAGVLTEVRGLDQARAVPGIEEVVISAHLGQQLVPLPEGSLYLGFIFARAARAEDVEAALRASHGRLEFIIRPSSDSGPSVDATEDI